MTAPHDPTDPRDQRDAPMDASRHDDDGADRSAIETRLADALSAYADTVEPAPGGWARLRGRVDGRVRTSRRAVVAVLAGAGAVAAAIALVVVLADDGDGPGGGVEMIPATPPTSGAVPTDPTGTTAPAEATTTTVAVPYGVDGVVAATADGRVVLLDVEGSEVRTLVDASEGRQVMQVALDPDRAHLWYLSKPAGTGGYGCGTLYEVATAEGATAASHGTGLHFALSPDGEHVAVSLRFDDSDPSTCNDDSMRSAISIRSTLSGDEQDRIAAEATAAKGPLFVQWLAWSPGGDRLAASICWEGCDVRVFDVAADADGGCPPGALCPASLPRTIADGVALVAEGSADYPAWTKDGRLVVNEHCCYPDDAGGSRVVAFDPATGARGEVLLDYADTPLRGITTDAGTPSTFQGDTRYLVVLYENSADIWVPPAAATTLAGDILAAAWAPGLVGR